MRDEGRGRYEVDVRMRVRYELGYNEGDVLR